MREKTSIFIYLFTCIFKRYGVSFVAEINLNIYIYMYILFYIYTYHFIHRSNSDMFLIYSFFCMCVLIVWFLGCKISKLLLIILIVFLLITGISFSSFKYTK